MDLLGTVRRPRRAEPQPARPTRSRTPSSGCTAPRSTSTPTCRASTSSAAGCPSSSASGCCGCCAHYGVEDLERTPELEEAVFRIFLAQQRSAPEVRLASAVLRPLDRRAAADRRAGRPQSAGLLERLGRATQLRFPVVGDLARSVRFRWFDQPPVDAERADVLAGVRDELAALAADGSLADRAERIDALAAIPEQIVRFLAERLEGGVPGQASRCSRCWSAGTTASSTCTTCESPSRTAARSWSPTTSLDDRPTRLVSTVGTIDELADPDRRRWPARSPRSSPRGRTGDEAVVDLYLHWPDAPESADEAERAAAAAGRRRCRSPATYAGSSVAVCPGGEPAGRLLRLPARPSDGRRGRGRPDPRRAPDGRPPAQPVAAAQLRRHPASRRPRTCCSTSAWPGTTPPTGGWSRWPRCASSPSSATRTAPSPRLPHAERAVENCLEAIRRARVARGAAGAKLDMNHVWVHVWPVVEADDRPA